MNKQAIFSEKQEEFIDLLIQKQKASAPDMASLPSIEAISKELGFSTACLREQMELARNLGLIKTQPRKGIEIQDYRFTPAVSRSLYYAVKLDRTYFEQFSDVRNHLEKIYFREAAALLHESDIKSLAQLTLKAQKKLHGMPVQIPHEEHRQYHLLIYQPLQNTFLNGLLEAYWDMYELIGLDVYTDLSYLEKVWNFHERVLEKLEQHDIEKAYQILIDHMQLIYQREIN